MNNHLSRQISSTSTPFYFRNTIQIFLICIVAGCTTAAIPEQTVLVRPGNNEITEIAIAKLQKEGGWYQIVDDDTLRVENPLPSYLIPTIEKAVATILPNDRSSAFPERMLRAILNRLEADGIAYKIVYFDGGPNLVWETSDSVAVNKVINDVSRFMNINNISEDNFRYKLD